MKSILISLTFLLAIASVLSESQVYKCASELGIDNLCYKATRQGSDNIIYVAGCAEDEYCPAKEEAYCTKKIVKKDEGDQCELDTECKSGMCTEGKCSTLPDGAECKKHYQCGQSSACRPSDSTCQPLLKEGEACDSDYECDFNLACGDGKCQKMFSLEVGAVSDNWKLCKSGISYKYKSKKGYNFYCVDKRQDTPTCPENYEKTCNFTVSIAEGDEHTYSEYCLPNWEYKPYCEMGSDFFLWDKFLEIYNEEIQKIDPTKIKVTELRSIFWSPKINMADMTKMFYARIKGAEKCVYDYFGMNYVTEQMKYFLE